MNNKFKYIKENTKNEEDYPEFQDNWVCAFFAYTEVISQPRKLYLSWTIIKNYIIYPLKQRFGGL